MSNKTNQKIKKTLQGILFTAGLCAVTIPAARSGYQFGTNNVSLDDIKARYVSASQEVVLQQYNKERVVQGVSNAMGLMFISGILYTAVVTGISDKNKRVQHFDEIDADEYMTSLDNKKHDQYMSLK